MTAQKAPKPESSSFGFYCQAGYNLVKVTGGLGPTDCNFFCAEVEKTEANSPQHYIFDFGALDRAGANWVQMIHHVHNLLAAKADRRAVRVVNARPEVLVSLQTAGLGPEIPICATLVDAFTGLGLLKQGSLDVNIVVPFINSIAEAVEKIIGVSTSKQRSVIQPGGSPFPGQVSGLISLSGPTFTGTVIVSFPQETLLQMISKLTGEKQTELTTLVTSAVGEFANIAATSAKKILNDIGYGLRCGLPTTLTAKEPPANQVANWRESVVVPLDTELGRYFIDIRY